MGRDVLDIDHEQLRIGEVNVSDDESLDNPRPDTGQGESRELDIPDGYSTVEEYLDAVL